MPDSRRDTVLGELIVASAERCRISGEHIDRTDELVRESLKGLARSRMLLARATRLLRAAGFA
jgi:hypothetical protein